MRENCIFEVEGYPDLLEALRAFFQSVSEYKEENDELIERLLERNLELDAEFQKLVARLRLESKHMISTAKNLVDPLIEFNGDSRDMFGFLNCDFYRINLERLNYFSENEFSKSSAKLGLISGLNGCILVGIVISQVIIILRFRKKSETKVGTIDCEPIDSDLKERN